MPKLDKSLYTKDEAAKLMEERRRAKALKQVKEVVADPPIDRQTDIAFVLGNGTSRKGIDPEEMKQYGVIYGCNALYREFEPDYLIAVDVKMVTEIVKSGYQHTHEVWTNPNKVYRNYENLNLFRPSKGWSSGPTALHLATQHGYNKIFILGFDYAGLDIGNGKKAVNNIYAGTVNYKKTTDGATYYGNWLKQTTAILKSNLNTTFYRIILPDNFVPPELNRFNNLRHIFVEEFKEMFNFS